MTPTIRRSHGTRVCACVLALVLAGCGEVAERGRPAQAEAAPAPPPPTTGLDSALLAEAQAIADSLGRIRSLVVARHGELEAEWYFNGAEADDLANVKSASKSILSALVGIAIAEGHLEGVDQPIAPFFEDELPADADPRLARVTIGDLLSMRGGLESTSFDNYGRWVTSSNWVRHVLSRPFVDEPGGRYVYSTGSTHLLSAILTRATGTSTLAYAREKLAEPLGFHLAAWPRDPQGVYFGGNDMRLRPRDLLRIGELYRDGGEHEGRQVVPADWIDRSWTVLSRSPWNGHGYGYGWWTRQLRGHVTRFAWGYGGQYLFIVPELELTVVVTSDPSAANGRSRNYRGDLIDAVERVVQAAEQGKLRATGHGPRATDLRAP